MEKPPESIIYPEACLQSGPQTHATEYIQTLVATFEGDFDKKIQNIFKELNKLTYDDTHKHALFRRRTADQILQSGFYTGCTDVAIAFIALARATGIPTRYVETLHKMWVAKGGSPMLGHVYAEVFDGKAWITVDPENKKMPADIYADGYVVIDKGADSYDIGITDFDSLRKKAEEFRK